MELTSEQTKKMIDYANVMMENDELKLVARLIAAKNSKLMEPIAPIVGELVIVTETIKSLIRTALNDELREWVRTKVLESIVPQGDEK